MSWSDAPVAGRGSERDQPRAVGGINPFTGPWSPPSGWPPVPSPASRRPRPRRGPLPPHAAGPAEVTAPVGRVDRLDGGRPGAGPVVPRRAPTGLFAANQRVIEPPAGLGMPRGPRPILSPLADPAGRRRRSWRLPGRRWWVGTAALLLVVGALGVIGTLWVAHRFAGPPPGLLVAARDLSYRVPADWQQRPGGPETSVGGVALDGVATAARYTCGGRGYHRATVGSTFLVRRDGVDARPRDAARDFGPLFATSFYGTGANVTATPPAPLAVAGQQASTSLVTVTPPAAAGCPGLVGRITVVALPTNRRGASGGTGVLLLVVQRDAAGGPATPAPVEDRTVSEILDTVQVTG